MMHFHGKIRIRKVALSWIVMLTVISFVGILGFCEWLVPRRFPKRTLQMDRLAQLHRIGHALAEYKEEHENRLPDRLSQLIPEYIKLDKVWVFFPPTGKDGNTAEPDDMEALRQRIDEEGIYIYRASGFADGNILAYEMPALWNEDSDGWPHGYRALLYSDFSATFAAQKEVVALGIPYWHTDSLQK